MARKPFPWYWPERKGWYTILRGKRHHLADQSEGVDPPKKRAGKWVVPQDVDQAFHALLAAPPEVTDKPAPPDPHAITIIEVLDKYLDSCKKQSAPATYDWYKKRIQSFINHAGQLARQPVSDLKAFHVMEWIDSHGDNWSPAYRRGAIIAIQRPFNWAAELDYISHSPIKKIKKPKAQRREQFVSPGEWDTIKSHYDEGDPFRDLLEFSWQTGCRPQESKRIEARHVDLDGHRVLFPPEEAKGKKRWRIIRMTPQAEVIVKELLDEHAEGPLFRNEDGQPWTSFAVACRFGRLQKHLGVKYCATAFRHGFAQDLLEQGADAISVSELLGHCDGSMLAKTYSHMNKADDHLHRMLKRRDKPVKAPKGD